MRRGDILIVEDAAETPTSSPSAVVQGYRQLRSACEVLFNAPLDLAVVEASGGECLSFDSETFCHKMDVDTADTLAEVKVAMVEALNALPKEGADAAGAQPLDPSAIHCRRGAYVGGTQGIHQCEMVKDETQPLSSLGVFNGSTLLLCHGRPHPPGHFKVEVAVVADAALCTGAKTDAAAPLCALVLDAGWTVLQLKRALGERLSKAPEALILRGLTKKPTPGAPADASPQYQLGPMLYDDKTMRVACKPKLADGYTLGVQKLPTAVPKLSRHSIVVVTRRWHPGWPGNKGRLGPAREHVLKKKATVSAVKEALSREYTDLPEGVPLTDAVLVAKWSRFSFKGMKPLSFANARSLDWDAANADPTLLLCGRELKFRDDNVLVHCAAAALAKSRAEIKAGKAREAAEAAAALQAAESRVAECKANLVAELGPAVPPVGTSAEGEKVEVDGNAVCDAVAARPAAYLDDPRPGVATLAAAYRDLDGVRAAAAEKAAKKGKRVGGRADAAVSRPAHPRHEAGVTIVRGSASNLANPCKGGCGWDMGAGNDADFCSRCAKVRSA